MNMQNLNQWLSLLANAGVVVGIVFLIIEVRQNDQIILQELALREASAFAQIEEQYLESSRQLASTPQLAELFDRFFREENPKYSRAEMIMLTQEAEQDPRIIHTGFRFWNAGHLPEPAWQRMIENVTDIKQESMQPDALRAKLQMQVLTNMPYDFMDYFDLNDFPEEHLDVSKFMAPE